MTDMEHKVERIKLDILDAETRVKDAREALEQGLKIGKAEIMRVTAAVTRDNERLRQELQRAENNLAREQSYLLEATEILNRTTGFVEVSKEEGQ